MQGYLNSCKGEKIRASSLVHFHLCTNIILFIESIFKVNISHNIKHYKWKIHKKSIKCNSTPVYTVFV